MYVVFVDQRMCFVLAVKLSRGRLPIAWDLGSHQILTGHGSPTCAKRRSIYHVLDGFIWTSCATQVVSTYTLHRVTIYG